MLLSAVGVVVCAIVLGTVMPAVLAHHDGVFFQSEIKAKLPPIAAKTLRAFEADVAAMQSHLDRIDRALASVQAGTQDHHVLLETRLQMSAALAAKSQPIQYFAFIKTPSSHLYFPLFFLTLGTLTVLARPPVQFSRRRSEALRTIPVALVVYLIWQWFHWVRNFVAGEEVRSIYAYTNWDLSNVCFVYQEIECLIISVLIANIWIVWLKYSEEVSAAALPETGVAWADVVEFSVTSRLSEMFSHWQLASATLVAAFSSFFVFYWRNIYGNHDERYLASALSIHAIGVSSWTIISLPFLSSWRRWRTLRLKALYEFSVSSDDVPRLELRNKMIEAAQPVGHWKLAVSSTLLALSFAAPIARILMK